MRGLRFHLMAQKPGYVRGVGLDVFEVFRKTMADLGWVMQIFCDWQVIGDMAPKLREIARDMPVIVDHYGMIAAGARRRRAEFPGAAAPGRRRPCARQGLGAVSRVEAIIPIMPTPARCTRRWSPPIRSG